MSFTAVHFHEPTLRRYRPSISGFHKNGAFVQRRTNASSVRLVVGSQANPATGTGRCPRAAAATRRLCLAQRRLRGSPGLLCCRRAAEQIHHRAVRGVVVPSTPCPVPCTLKAAPPPSTASRSISSVRMPAEVARAYRSRRPIARSAWGSQRAHYGGCATRGAGALAVGFPPCFSTISLNFGTRLVERLGKRDAQPGSSRLWGSCASCSSADDRDGTEPAWTSCDFARSSDRGCER